MAQQGGFGLVLKINTGALTTVVDLIDCSFPEQKKILADATTHDSTGGYREWIATGVRELSEATATVIWDDAQATHAQFLTSFAADTAVNMSIQDPDGQEVIAFAAHITGIKRIDEMEGLYKAEITFQPTGAPTIT
jgi:predicted secreted protein